MRYSVEYVRVIYYFYNILYYHWIGEKRCPRLNIDEEKQKETKGSESQDNEGLDPKRLAEQNSHQWN